MDPGTEEWDGNGSPAATVLSLNVQRRHLTASQCAAVSAEFEALLAAKAKQRMSAGGKTAGRGRPRQGKEKLPSPVADAGHARDQAAKLTGVSGRYVSDAKRIKATDPVLHKRVINGELTIPQARVQLKNQEKRAALEAKAAAVNGHLTRTTHSGQ